MKVALHKHVKKHGVLQSNDKDKKLAEAVQHFLGAAFGSLFVAALFFTTSGETVSVRDPDECGKGSLPVLRAIITGVCSALISSIFILAVSKLHKRDFVYCGEWPAEKKKKLLNKWRMLDVCLMACVAVYLCFCILFVGLFLSQVSGTDKSAFFVSTVVA